jgi:hypothetical protein
VPQLDSCSAAKEALFDHLVGSPNQGGWHHEAECLRGFEINNQLKFGWLFDWKIGWLCPFQNFIT